MAVVQAADYLNFPTEIYSCRRGFNTSPFRAGHLITHYLVPQNVDHIAGVKTPFRLSVITVPFNSALPAADSSVPVKRIRNGAMYGICPENRDLWKTDPMNGSFRVYEKKLTYCTRES